MSWNFRRVGQSASNQPSSSAKPKPALSAQQNCSSDYPGVCIPPDPPDLNYPDISWL
ncbi:hypothetical protein [Trichocoleus sp. FACHB-832]|uniref:hypothetical protein n=1 Tax=Trichocoleus sp. FACHB-832 TaxID=2692875 RepID=UPI0018EFE267|nr:hypothetical protein [Trichocoleus sp. FACHB-832]